MNERVFDAVAMALALPHDLSIPALATRIEDPAERRARVRQLAAGLAPVSLASQQRLPVVPALAQMLPAGGPSRGSTVSVGGRCGALSLAALLAVEASKAGSWVVAVGMAEFNWEAALALGVVAERSVVVRLTERSRVTEVMAALVDAADVVLVGPEVVLAASAVRRLRARARERGSVLIRVQPQHARRVAQGAVAREVGRRGLTAASDDRWEGVELSLHARTLQWSGLGQGWGHLSGRLVEVVVGGRRQSSGGGRSLLWLPDVQGRVRVPEPGELSGLEREGLVGADGRVAHAAVGRLAPVVALRPTGTG